VDTTAMNSCYVVGHQVPITFTAGIELLNTAGGVPLQDGPQLQSQMEEDVREACGSTLLNVTSTSSRGSTTTTSSPTGTRLLPGGGSSATVTPTAMGANPSTTGSSAGVAATTSSKSRGCRLERMSPVTVLLVVLAKELISLFSF
jgi:hypothetical protein